MFALVLRAIILCGLCLATPLLLRAQQRGAQRPASPANANETDTIRIGTSLVMLNVGIFDQKGREVGGLTKESFTIHDNGQPQATAFFGQIDEPLSFGLLVDNSQSMGDSAKLANAKAALRAFLRTGNPRSEAFCLTFNQTPSLLADYTSDYARIESALDGLTADGGTALYDAIGEGLERLRRGKYARRALLVITDGRDQHSQTTLPALLKQAQQSDAQIYIISFFSPVEDEVYKKGGAKVALVDGTEVDNPRVVFQTLAAETGAETFFPRSAGELEKTMVGIAASLRRQYTLAFYPNDQHSGDGYHRLAVKLADAKGHRWQVRTRQGYRLSEPLSAAQVSDQPNVKPAAANVTPSLSAIAPRILSADKPVPPVYRETFDSPAQGWPQNERAYAKNGKYFIRGQQLVPAPLDEYADFETSVVIFFPTGAEDVGRRSGGSVGAMTDAGTLPTAGLSFRINEQGYYAIAISPALDRKGGYFRLLKISAGEKSELIGWRKDSAIQPRSELKVRCRGPQIEIFINQLRVAVLKDDSHRQGRIGLTTGDNEAIFDDLQIKKIE